MKRICAAGAERLLLALCLPPERVTTKEDVLTAAPEPAPLASLRKSIPNFSSLVRGRSVLDFGCGFGWQAAALAREEECTVTGLDTNEETLRRARELAAAAGHLGDRLRFVSAPLKEMEGRFDVVLSVNSMEHFSEPAKVLEDIRRLAAPNGIIIIHFGCPWYSPYGSHMHFFCKVPWINLLFSERTVMAVRSRFRSDGAERYEQVESGLNKMSITAFERLIAESRLSVRFLRYTAVKQLPLVHTVPLLRELLINQVSCILSHPDAEEERTEKAVPCGSGR